MRKSISKSFVCLLAVIAFVMGISFVFAGNNYVLAEGEVIKPHNSEIEIETKKAEKELDDLYAKYDVNYRPAEMAQLGEIIEIAREEVNKATTPEAIKKVVKDTALALEEKASELMSEADYEAKIGWNGKRVVKSLEYMGIGMLCIFVVIGVIVLSVVILNKATSPKKSSTDEENN